MHIKKVRVVEGVAVLVFCCLVVVQCFVVPVVGLANNGDFGKMIGRFGLGTLDDGPDSAIVFAPTAYVFHPARYFVAEHISSELLLILPAVMIGWATNPLLFDLRTMGAVHAVGLVAGFALLLPLSRGLSVWRRVVLLGLLIIVLGDVHHVSYVNSFYTDMAALIGMLFTLAAGLHLALREHHENRWLGAFAASACFMIASKPQHAVLALLLFPLALSFALRRDRNWLGHLLAGSLLVVGAVTLALTPPAERAMNLYSATFIRVPQVAQDTTAALREIGLGDEFIPHLGRWAYQEGAPDNQWFLAFGRTHGYGRLALWYVRHPMWTLKILAADLQGPASHIRMPILGNYRKEDGFPPGTQARSHDFWSGLRSRMIRLYPWHLPVWFALYLSAFSALLWFRRGTKEAWFAAVALVVGAMAVVEFVVPALADGVETDRHLFLFHALTDASVLLALTAILTVPYHAIRARMFRISTKAAVA